MDNRGKPSGDREAGRLLAGSKASEGTSLTDTILDFQPPEWSDQVLLFMPPSCGIVMAVEAQYPCQDWS